MNVSKNRSSANDRVVPDRREVRPTPNTHQFTKYLEEEVLPILRGNVSRTQVSVLMDVLRFLEQQRYDYSADRAFQTRPISNAAIAERFDVTERTVRRWFSQLEDLGILTREHRKNPNHRYKNLLNRIRFSSFWGWFKGLLAKTPVSQCPPNKKDIKNISISSKNSKEKREQVATFPKTGSIRYDRYWKALAEKHLPSGRGRPCMDMIAQKFRLHLKKYKIAFDAPNIKTHWTNYCERAPIISYGRRKFVQPADAPPEAKAIEEQVAETIETPDFKADHPFDQVAKLLFERSPAVWKNWIKPLTARCEGNVWIVETPSNFHKNYVVSQFEEIFDRYFGRGGVRFV